MDDPVFIVPGIGNSGPGHWQSLWQDAHSQWRRLIVDDWDHVECDDWISAIDLQIGPRPADTVIVAHSLGCLAVAHWAARSGARVRGALLVAVPDPEAPVFPKAAATGFAPLPSAKLAFPSMVVSSSNDPYGSEDHARKYAAAWGSEWLDAGARGHLNGQSDLGDWTEGLKLVKKLQSAR
jgi:predicted alpha/beta hydrolase family esterase